MFRGLPEAEGGHSSVQAFWRCVLMNDGTVWVYETYISRTSCLCLTLTRTPPCREESTQTLSIAEVWGLMLLQHVSSTFSTFWDVDLPRRRRLLFIFCALFHPGITFKILHPLPVMNVPISVILSSKIIQTTSRLTLLSCSSIRGGTEVDGISVKLNRGGRFVQHALDMVNTYLFAPA
jgi:hypothetical protein